MEPLKENELLPGFELESMDGNWVDPQSYRNKKNLVLLLFSPECDRCWEFLKEAADRYDEYKQANAEVMVVVESPIDSLREQAEEMHLPFRVLADPDGVVITRFSGGGPLLIVADRFGEIRMTAFSEEQLPDQKKVLDRLSLIELECPECGVSTWPV